MKIKSGFIYFLFIAGFLFQSTLSPAQRIMEKLSRGTVAVCSGTDSIFVSWRLLATDPGNIAFNIYKNDIRITSEPIKNATSFLDKKGKSGDNYSVVPVIGKKEINNSTDKTIAISTPYSVSYTHLTLPTILRV